MATTDSPRTAATIELTVESSDLIWEDFVQAGNELTGILGEVESSITSTDQSGVRWSVVELSKASPARVVFAGRPTRPTISHSTIEHVVEITTSGLQRLREGVDWPPEFTEGALEHAKKLADLVGDRVTEIRVQNGSAPVVVTRQVSMNVDELIAPRFRSLGTVEGRLEGINIHAASPYATIYEMLDERPIRAHFTRDLLSEMTAVFGRRIAAFGEILSRPTGERYSITVRRIEALSDETALPDPDTARGVLGSDT